MSELYQLIKDNDQDKMRDYFHAGLTHGEIAAKAKELAEWEKDPDVGIDVYLYVFSLFIDVVLAVYPKLAIEPKFRECQETLIDIAVTDVKLKACRFILGLVRGYALGNNDLEKGLPELTWSEPVRALSRERDQYVIAADTEHGELKLYFNPRLGTYHGSHKLLFWEILAKDLEQAKRMVVGLLLNFIVKAK